MTGTLETVASVARSKGRTNGTIQTYKWNYDTCTIGGTRIVSTNAAGCSMVWDADFEWAIVNANTTYLTNTKTSAERIAEWQAAGKRVIVYNNM